MARHIDTRIPFLRFAFAAVLCLGAALPAQAQWQQNFVFVTSIAFSPDGRYVAAGNIEDWASPGDLRVWDVKSGRLIHKVRYVYGVEDLTFSPDGKTLAVATQSEWSKDNVRLWDFKSWRTKRTLGRDLFPLSLIYSPDGKKLFTGSDMGETGETVSANWIDLKSGVSHELPRSEGVARILASSQFTVGAFYSGYNNDGSENLRAWNAKGRFLWRKSQPGLQRIVFLRGGKSFLAAIGPGEGAKKTDGALQIREAGTGKILSSFWQSSGVIEVAVSQDGYRWATVHHDHTVKLWDAKSRRVIRTLPLKARGPLVFSPDGRFLASSDEAHLRVTNISE